MRQHPTETRASPDVSDPKSVDDELVARAKKGDTAAFRSLVDRHQRRLFQLAFGVLKDQEEAMDVVQESFIKIYKNLPLFQGDSAFSTWAYRITHNMAIDAYRRTRKSLKNDEIQENSITDEGSHHEPYAITSANPQKASMRSELGHHLKAALAQLSEEHRSILVMREVEGLSYEELSENLGIPKGTVMSRLFHARHKMQLLMKEYMGEDAPSEPALSQSADPRKGARS